MAAELYTEVINQHLTASIVEMQRKQWTRQEGGQTFTVSTAPELINPDFIQASFADPLMYWIDPLPPDQLETLLRNSFFFGLYVRRPTQSSSPSQSSQLPTGETSSAVTQIGMARLITDHVTLAWLEDVFIAGEYQGRSLGKWLVQCVKEVTETMPGRRRTMFMAKNAPHAVKFYQEGLGAQMHDQERSKVVFMSTRVQGLDA